MADSSILLICISDKLFLEGLKNKVLNLEILTEKEKDLIVLLYGLNGNEQKSREELAEMYNVTNQRIKQITEQALTKIRRSSIIKYV